MSAWLVVGVGNPMRRDDGLGPWLADRVAAWGLPNVTVRTTHQLTPELAADVAQHDHTLFVDASHTGEPLHLVSICPAAHPGGLGHALTPGEVMALARDLYGRSPPAWLLPVTGVDFEYGEGLSAEAEAAGEAALEWARANVLDPCLTLSAERSR